MNGIYTKTELDMLLLLRRKPRTREYLQNRFSLKDEAMNIMLSNMSGLIYSDDPRGVWHGTLRLNQPGITVAQSEYERRFDMYYTRTVSIAALVTSVASVIISAAALLK